MTHLLTLQTFILSSLVYAPLIDCLSALSFVLFQRSLPLQVSYNFFFSVLITIFLKYNYCCVIFSNLSVQLNMQTIFEGSSDFTDKRQLFNFLPMLQRSAVNLENIGCMRINSLFLISSNAHQKVICFKSNLYLYMICFFSQTASLFSSLVLVSHISFIFILNSGQDIFNSNQELQDLDLSRNNFNIKVRAEIE